MPGRRPAVIVAGEKDGPIVQALVADSGYDYLRDLDWSRVSPWWLIAILDGKPAGCIQIAASLPIGRMEYLCIRRMLSHRDRAKVAHALSWRAMAYLRGMGCGMVQGIVGAPYEGWVKRMVKRGARVVVSGDMVARRLR